MEGQKKRGTPLGNQYARKHGFYSKVLDEQERKEYERAVKVEGLDDEIAIMRIKIRSLIEKDPENLKLITQALNSLERMIKTRYTLDSEEPTSIWEGVENVLKGIAVPLGFTIGEFLKRQ